VIAMITSTREGPLPPDWLGVWVLIFSPVRAGALVGLAPGVCVTLVAVAVEVAAVGDRLVVALGDAPVVGDEDETAGRVERGVVDGLDVDVLVGDGLGVDVAVGDGDGLGVGDGQIKGRSHSLAAYEFFTTAREPIAEITNSKSARTPTTTCRRVRRLGLCSCPLPRNCCREEGPDLSDWPGFRLFPFIRSKIKNAPRLARSPPHLLLHSNEPHHDHFAVSIPQCLYQKREKPEK